MEWKKKSKLTEIIYRWEGKVIKMWKIKKVTQASQFKTWKQYEKGAGQNNGPR
jgi:hypothetical protein